MMRHFFSSAPSRLASFFATLLLLLAASAPALAEGGNGGYEYCYTNYPDATGYIAGQPTYISAVFRFPGDSYNGPKLFDYVKQHYGVANPGPVGCSYGSRPEQAQNGLASALAKIKAGGYKVVETGWVLSGSAAVPPPSPGQVQSATAPPAVKGAYTFCNVQAGSKDYVSVVMPDANPHLQLVQSFQSYIKQKYSPPGALPLPSCGVYDSQDYANQMFHQWVLTEGAKGIQTGWKYNGSVPASAAAPAPTPSTPAPVNAATTASSAAPAPPAEGTITVRLVDPINSFTDPPGRHYRAVVIQAVTVGNVNIPVDTLSTVTVSGSAGNLSAHLDTLSPNGQQPLNVTTSAVTPVTAGSNAAVAVAAAGAKQVQSIMSLGGFRKPATPKAVSVMTQGDKVVLPPGTTLSFTTSVPQSSTLSATSSSH